MKKLIAFFFLIFLFPINLIASGFSEEYEYNLYRAKVIELSEQVIVTSDGSHTIQEAKVEIINRDKKGETTIIVNNLTGDPVYDMPLKEGSIISVHYEEGSFYFISYDNFYPLLLLLLVFLIVLVVIGGMKGLKSLVALGITLSLIVFVMLPLLIKGVNPILAAIFICTVSTVVTFFIISGVNKKSLSATFGTIGGLIMAGLIAYVFGSFARLTGFSTSDASMLLYLPEAANFDFRGLLFAGIIIGALGAAMDVAISIASALNELECENAKIEAKNLINSGFNIGRDVMGTMINTLVLAYVGGTITIMLLFVGLNTSLNHIMNLDFIATEIVRAVAGSIGLLFAIPFTIFAYVLIPWHKGVEKCKKQ